MNLKTAHTIGKVAYDKGLKCIPALDKKFLIEACASDIDTAKLLKCWIKGWTCRSIVKSEFQLS